MKKSLIAGLACLSLTVSSGASIVALASPSNPAISTDNGQSTLRPISSHVSVIAQTGAAAYGPENTLAAYKQAMKQQANYIELNVQMTKDGHLIVMNDSSLTRTTNVKQMYADRAPWQVQDFTLEEIKRLDAGSWFKAKNQNKQHHGKDKGQRVPTLAEAIQLVKKEGHGKVGLYINVNPGMEEELAETLKNDNFLDVVFESVSEDSLRTLQSLLPDVSRIQLYTADMLEGKDIFQEFKRVSDYATGVGPTQDLVVPTFMEAAHENHLLVQPKTVNTQDDMVSMLSLGVDGEFTNNPGQLINLMEKPFISHGVASGDVTDSSALLWARTNGPAKVQFEISTDSSFKHPIVKNGVAQSEQDYTVHVNVDGLQADTKYFYRAHALSSDYFVNGSFKTVPEKNSLKPVTMVWGGDTGGQGEIPPYKTFQAMSALNPDYFLFLGDSIYADNKTPAVPNPPSQTIQDYWAKYKENRTDAGLRSLLQKAGTYAIWDDHEVINDFSGPSQPLTPTGLRAFEDYMPISSERSSSGKLYHKYSWGNTMDMIMLNNRGYRSPNTMADGPDKTMLGQEQLDWLKQQLLDSKANVKFVVTTVPISIATGKHDARDGWANGDNVDPNDPTGFENEFKQISDFIIDNGIKNVYFVSTDVHFAEVIKYDANHDGKTDYHELISGPIGAVKINPPDLDPTFGPESLYAEGGFFNFGVFQVDPAKNQATVEIRDENGKAHYSQTFQLED